MAQGVKEGEAEAREDDGPGQVAETEAAKEGEEVNLPTLPMTREEFWRQYWDRIDCAGSVAAEIPEPNPFEGCWIWIGTTDANGYGVVFIQKQKWLTHRLAYQVFNGELEPGLSVLHNCNTKPCCNPTHLRLGRPDQNWDDAREDGDYVETLQDFMRGARAEDRRPQQRVTSLGW